jgi:hypothetical protein
MASVEKKALVSLKTWYAQLRPNTVDIVGDFAGKELFLIHGESLLRHCLDEVDFHGQCRPQTPHSQEQNLTREDR